MSRAILFIASLASCSGIEGDTCEHPFEVATFPYAREIDLAEMHADIRFTDTNGCVPNSQTGEDAVFAVELSAGQELTASLACSFSGASLFALFDCARGLSSSDCIDGAALGEPPTVPATIRFWADTDDTYFVIVDYQGPPLAASGLNVCDLEIVVE